MADAVTSTTIQDGNRIAVIQLTNTSDGTGESAVTKVDVSALATRKSDGATCTGCKLAKLSYTTFGMSVKLLSSERLRVPFNYSCVSILNVL